MWAENLLQAFIVIVTAVTVILESMDVINSENCSSL
jgi:hypothetical protein